MSIQEILFDHFTEIVPCYRLPKELHSPRIEFLGLWCTRTFPCTKGRSIAWIEKTSKNWRKTKTSFQASTTTAIDGANAVPSPPGA